MTITIKIVSVGHLNAWKEHGCVLDMLPSNTYIAYFVQRTDQELVARGYHSGQTTYNIHITRNILKYFAFN